jgi:hypothetical protein
VAGTTTVPRALASFAGSKSAITVTRAGGFSFTFQATDARTGSATFGSAGKIRVGRKSKSRKSVTLARMSFAVLPGGKVSLRVKLSKEGLRILTLNRRISARITVTLTNAAGQTTTSTQAIVLKAPQPLPR